MRSLLFAIAAAIGLAVLAACGPGDPNATHCHPSCTLDQICCQGDIVPADGGGWFCFNGTGACPLLQ